MDSMVQQVLIVCPDVAEDDVRRDLLFSGDAQETINRIFDGNFLQSVGGNEVEVFQASSVASGQASSSIQSSGEPSLPSTLERSSGRAEGDNFNIVKNALFPLSDEEQGPSTGSVASKGDLRSKEVLEVTHSASMAGTVQRSAHERVSPISIASSDHHQDSDEDELPSIFLSSRTIPARSEKTFPSESKNQRLNDIGRTFTGSVTTSLPKQDFKVKTKLTNSDHHIHISSSDSDSELDSHNVKGHGLNVRTAAQGSKEKGSRPLTVDVNSDSSSDEDDYIELGLLHRLQNKKFKSAACASHKPSGTVKDTKSNSTSIPSSYLAKSTGNKNQLGSDKHKLVKDAIFSQVSSRTHHAVSESDDNDSEGESMDTQGVYSEETTSTLHSQTSSSTSYSQATDSLDSQTLMSQGSCSSSTSQKRPKRTPEEIEAAKNKALERKMEKERKRQERARLIEEKKQQKQKEADQRKTIRDAKRAEKPGECIKHMTVIMDSHIIEEPSGAQILAKLQAMECKYAIEPQPIPACIKWRRTVVDTNLLGENIQLEALTSVKEEAETLVVLSPAEFVEMVHAYKGEQRGEYSVGAQNLCSYVRDLQARLGGIIPTLVVQSMEKYFRAKKNIHQRQYRNAVLGVAEEEPGRGRKRKRKPEDIQVIVSRVDVEEALVDLQLRHTCNVRFVETAEQMSDLVAMFTKAVAETPFKRKRDEAKFSFHVHVDWAGGVKVGKDGRGLLKVWRQQFQQFRNVSPEIASTIVAQYPSPQLLLQAYKRCPSEDAAKKLLQDIVVRRGEGVLATSRRVGPELSRRVYNLFNSRNGELML